MNKEEIVKGKNLFDEEKIIDTGTKKPLFVRIPFDEYRKLQEEKDRIDKLKTDKNKLINYIAIRENKTHEEVCKEFEIGE